MKVREPIEMSRRDACELLLAGALVSGFVDLAKGGKAMAEPTSAAPVTTTGLAPAYRGTNQVKPLPFDPAKLDGLSEKLVTSHHQNNYGGAVKRLNQIQQQLGALPKDAAPYQLGSLKREELIATNSMILHELYFGNLGGHGKASGTIVSLLRERYGTLEAWEAEFRLTGLSLAGGSGWVVLYFDPHARGVQSCWAADHTHGLAGAVPLLVMDMYEHSYHMDYGADAKSYVDAFFRNVDWEEVNRRAEAARRAETKP